MDFYGLSDKSSDVIQIQFRYNYRHRINHCHDSPWSFNGASNVFFRCIILYPGKNIRLWLIWFSIHQIWINHVMFREDIFPMWSKENTFQTCRNITKIEFKPGHRPGSSRSAEAWFKRTKFKNRTSNQVYQARLTCLLVVYYWIVNRG